MSLCQIYPFHCVLMADIGSTYTVTSMSLEIAFKPSSTWLDTTGIWHYCITYAPIFWGKLCTNLSTDHLNAHVNVVITIQEYTILFRVLVVASVFARKMYGSVRFLFSEVSHCYFLRQPNWKIFVCSANWLSLVAVCIWFSRHWINSRLLLWAFVSAPFC